MIKWATESGDGGWVEGEGGGGRGIIVSRSVVSCCGHSGCTGKDGAEQLQPSSPQRPLCWGLRQKMYNR